MALLRKLLYFFLGVGLGSLIVIFLFGDRDFQCSYFPNDRVLYDLRKKERLLTPDMQIRLNQFQLDTADLSRMLERGRVDFERSRPRREDTCKTYWIDSRSGSGPEFSAEWLNCDSTAILLQLHR